MDIEITTITRYTSYTRKYRGSFTQPIISGKGYALRNESLSLFDTDSRHCLRLLGHGLWGKLMAGSQDGSDLCEAGRIGSVWSKLVSVWKASRMNHRGSLF